MIEVPDTVPPDIVVIKKTYFVRAGTDRAQIEAELLANFNAYDDLGGEVTLSVKFTENIDAIGISEVEYIATDSATAHRSRKNFALLRSTSPRYSTETKSFQEARELSWKRAEILSL